MRDLFFAAAIKADGLPKTAANDATISKILAIVFAVIGALAFLMIVIAGLRYIAAAGDPQKTAQAKNTIIYALIGIALAISAEVIVAFTVRSV